MSNPNKMDFKIGTRFIITNKPIRWTSHFNKNNPIESDIKYPYYGKIVDIHHDEYGYVAMTDGIYSWSLSCLLQENKIINLTKDRKEKLNKLKKYNEHQR